VIGRGIHAGCEDLLKVVEKIKPAYHLFGHIHEAYGRTSNGCTTFVNGSTLNERYELANEAITFNTL
jgi:Icc-related predicted phosphoesterase